MIVTLNLTPETQRRLQEKAARTGLTLEAFLNRLAEREAFDRNGAGAAEDAASHSGQSEEGIGDRDNGSAPADSFIACEEDRPVPVKMHLSKPFTPLDPDADFLSSFEP
jgi:hypothetical protein